MTTCKVPADTSVYSQLCMRLVDIGYFQFYLSFGNGNLRVADWAVARDYQSHEIKLAVDLLLLGNPVSRNEAVAVIGLDAIAALEEDGVLNSKASEVSLSPYKLICFDRVFLFFEYSGDPQVYFGDDSVALGTYLQPAVNMGAALDLCSGTAVQAMIMARHVEKVVAVEVNPQAAKVARINIGMNELQSRVELVHMDLHEYTSNTEIQFDLISFNPPLLPIPDNIMYPFVGHGGHDGLKVTKRIIETSHCLLSETGSIQFIGTGLMSASYTEFVEAVSDVAHRSGLSGFIQVISKHPLEYRSPVFERLTSSVVDASPMVSRDDAGAKLIKFYRDKGATDLAFFYCRLRRGAKLGIKLIRTDNAFYGGWFL